MTSYVHGRFSVAECRRRINVRLPIIILHLVDPFHLIFLAKLPSSSMPRSQPRKTVPHGLQSSMPSPAPFYDLSALSCFHSRELEPTRRHIDIFAHENLLLPLGAQMLHPHFLTVLRLELAYKHRVPQLGCNTQILAAAHQSVGFAALCRGGYTLRVEVLLFAAGDRHEST